MNKNYNLFIFLKYFISFVFFINMYNCIYGNITAIKKNSLENKGYKEIFNEKLGYNFLGTLDNGYILQKIYNTLLEEKLNIKTYFSNDKGYKNKICKFKTISSNITIKDLSFLCSVFVADNPEIFWINDFVIKKYNDHIVIIFYSNYTKNDILRYNELIYKNIISFFSNIPPKLSEYSRELWIHDKLLKEVEYSKNTPDYVIEDHNIIGSLIHKKAVCESFSLLLKVLFNKAGIRCYTTICYVKSILHMLNIVKIENTSYFLDFTWDLTCGPLNSYDYFNINYDIASKERIFYNIFLKSTEQCKSFFCYYDKFNCFLKLENFKSLKYNYLLIESIKFSNSNKFKKELYSKLIKILKNDRKIIHIKFNSSDEMNEFMIKNNFNEIISIAKMTNKINISKINYTLNASQNIVNIEFI